MKTNKTQKRRPTGPISTGVVLLAILALLLMQGQALAFWETLTWVLVWRGGW